VLAVLAVLGVLALVSTGVVVTVSAIAVRTDTGTLRATRIDSIRVTGTAVSLTVVGDGAADVVTGQWSTKSALRDAGVMARVTDGVFVIVADCPEQHWSGAGCETELTLRVPRTTVLDLQLGVATVTATELGGDIDASVNAGSLDMSRLSSQRVHASNNAGQVVLGFDRAPQSVIASTNVGEVTVRVPDDGTGYNVQTASNIGDDTSSIPNDPSADRVINASTNVGSVTVTAGPPTGQSPGDR